MRVLSKIPTMMVCSSSLHHVGLASIMWNTGMDIGTTAKGIGVIFTQQLVLLVSHFGIMTGINYCDKFVLSGCISLE
jgi:hypothetical protein